MRQPDPKNVRDALLTAGYSDEEVELMLAALSGDLQSRVAETVRGAVLRALYIDGLELRAARIVDRLSMLPLIERLKPHKGEGR